MSLVFFLLIGGIVMVLGYLSDWIAVLLLSGLTHLTATIPALSITMPNETVSSYVLMVCFFLGYASKLERMFVKLYYHFGKDVSLMTYKETAVARVLLTGIMSGFFMMVNQLVFAFDHLSNSIVALVVFLSIFGLATKYWFDHLFGIKKALSKESSLRN